MATDHSIHQSAADLDAVPRRLAFVLVAVLAVFAAVALLWMALARIDVAVNARGSVIAPSRVQEVASLEGGIVHRVLVKAGDSVARGQPLAQLDRAQYAADLGESLQARRALHASRIRVDALLSGRAPDFSSLDSESSALVREEQRLWQEAWREHQAGQAAAAEGIRTRAAELQEAHARIASLQAAEASSRESLQIEERLMLAGAGARTDFLAAQQRWLALNGDLSALRESLPRLQAALAEARARAAELTARARAQWGVQRTEIEGKLGTLLPQVQGREDRLLRREILSPMEGVVNRVLITTQGGVVGAGAPILEIVPHDDALRVTARVSPADVGFLRPRQRANVRVAAFDSSIYGTLEATVARVGADVLLDDDKQAYFEVELVAARNHLEHNGRPLALQPGMTVDVGILTGERTVLQYLLKPVFKTLGTALQER